MNPDCTTHFKDGGGASTLIDCRIQNTLQKNQVEEIPKKQMDSEEIKPVPFSSKGNAPPSHRAPMQGHFTAALNAERNGSLDRATE